MPEPVPEEFIARIFGPRGDAAGVGTLVGPRQVVTCAHVVNVALGLDPRTQGVPDGLVTLDFPLAPGQPADDEPARYTATVEKWAPPSRQGAAGLDLAGLVLVDGLTPAGTVPARLAVDVPLTGSAVRVFGYPSTPPRPDGAWVSSVIRGRVAAGGGRIQLDSGPDAALRVQPGFSGGPVYDDATGRVVGLLATAAGGLATERDSYAISADTVSLTWPDWLAPSRPNAGRGARPGSGRAGNALTILHLSDVQFGGQYLFGGRGRITTDRAHAILISGLRADLASLASEHGVRPDLMVVTGGLTSCGLPHEFGQITDFLAAIAEVAQIPRAHVAIVPGNHDVNQKACEAYFADQEADQLPPTPPYSRKWKQFIAAFAAFYDGISTVSFTPDEHWSLFEMPDLAVVVAGLNSTVAETHRPDDHYGYVGDEQLGWFADRLGRYQKDGWLRLAAVHHHVSREAAGAQESLRDTSAIDRVLGQPGLVNLLLHGHARSGRPRRLRSGLITVSAGTSAIDDDQVPNQYQVITLRRDGLTQHARRYDAGHGLWTGDSRIAGKQGWIRDHQCQFADVDTTFLPLRLARPDARVINKHRKPAFDHVGAQRGTAEPIADPLADFRERVAEATRVSFPEATITIAASGRYLRVSNPLPGGGAVLWPVGVTEGPVTDDVLTDFLTQVHARFASPDPLVRSEFVYGGAPATDDLVARARKAGVAVRSFVEYQGLLDLRPLAARQNERLASDQLYPERMYVPQRFHIASSGFGPEHSEAEILEGLIEQALAWLSADSARFVMVLGDFGRGKTAFLRQLARVLPAELPALLPVLVELRSLEKAPSLDELLAQHLVRQGVEDISPAKLRYMISSGRLALLFDGFDELELRVGYDNAADYLQVLLESVTDRAKVVLTSRTQHFQSADQIRTALGQRVATRSASRVAVLEDFSDTQVLRFLTSRYQGDEQLARARFDLLGEVHDLLGLGRNPRMLAFIAGLDEDRLRDIQREHGTISAAELYREIITFWLAEEARRQEHRRGLTSLDEQERLKACTALALRQWTSASPAMRPADLSAGVTETLDRLTERGYTTEQASHSIGSGSLLTRTDDGTFTFVHQSIMEWLVAAAAARELTDNGSAPILASRAMSKLMVDFFIDLVGPQAAYLWATDILASPEWSEASKQNALAALSRLGLAGQPQRQNLADVDLRGQDLANRDLRHSDLSGANLSGMRLTGTDLSAANLSGADLSRCRMTGGSLRDAILTGSRWDRAALLGTDMTDDQAASPELAVAAIPSRNPADLMTDPQDTAWCVTFSPDGTLVAISSGNVLRLIDLADERPVRILAGHGDLVTGVAFSPDGTRLATASSDGTARIWDTADGTTRLALQGHSDWVTGVAFSPDGTQLATASDDGTARIWDTRTGHLLATLVALPEQGYVAVGRDGYKVQGDPTGYLWWAIKLCRFEIGELDPYVPELTRLPLEAPLLPL